MSEEGLFKLDDEIILHKELYKNGNGIMKYLSNTNKMTYTDACKMVMAVSDNLCADELLHKVGFDRINNLFIKAGCINSKISEDLNTMVSNLINEIPKTIRSTFYHDVKYFAFFNRKLKELLTRNFTNAKDINTCFQFIMDGYLNPKFRDTLLEFVLVPNVHTRIAAYTYFSKFYLRGKTGALGFGIVNNETVAIIQKNTKLVKGYFTLNTNENRHTNFQTNDLLALVGLEIAKLYEQLYPEN